MKREIRLGLVIVAAGVIFLSGYLLGSTLGSTFGSAFGSATGVGKLAMAQPLTKQPPEKQPGQPPEKQPMKQPPMKLPMQPPIKVAIAGIEENAKMLPNLFTVNSKLQPVLVADPRPWEVLEVYGDWIKIKTAQKEVWIYPASQTDQGKILGWTD